MEFRKLKNMPCFDANQGEIADVSTRWGPFGWVPPPQRSQEDILPIEKDPGSNSLQLSSRDQFRVNQNSLKNTGYRQLETHRLSSLCMRGLPEMYWHPQDRPRVVVSLCKWLLLNQSHKGIIGDVVAAFKSTKSRLFRIHSESFDAVALF